ncbi:dihydroneopterin aldolase [Bacteroides sp. OttesenSCG-928-D19]|nr:dihydroneopterin aldolase [Bacteroides sp. OttesenSCG-928-N06]MDL2305550.1 dihydroneopterin aldolase [Bacteroides sp. OttesenSCG-928-D19]
MRIRKSYICLEEVSFYSYHGIMPQEREVGNNYIINLRLTVDLEEAMRTDDVQHTVNYANIHQLLAEEMAIPSNLLEHVCGRIIERLFLEYQSIEEIDIKLSKKNPPMGADIAAASVKIHCVRYNQ